MSKLGRVVEAVENYNQFVEDEVKRARTDRSSGSRSVERWNEIKAKIAVGDGADRFETAAPGLARDRRAGRDHALPVRRWLAGRVSRS